MPKIAFLGAGRMASAMAEGLIARGGFAPADLACLGGSGATAAALAARTGMVRAASLDDLLRGSDALVVAFKPQQLAAADPRLAELTEGKLVLSVLAGKKLDRLERTFPKARNRVRCMPNTPGQIGAGITAWCSARPLVPADRATLSALLGALGESVQVEEAQMDAVTGLSGSGPAYVFEFAAALREAGVAAGLSPETAAKLAEATLLGAGRLLAARGEKPETLRDQVTSPNGTTYAGLQRLASGNFRGLVRDVVLAAAARSSELAKEG